MTITVAAHPPKDRRNAHYPGHRAPLLPAPLIRLPLGAMRPGGWLAGQLELMADGMVGRLKEVSRHLAASNGWLGGEEPGWEEQPYWLRGFHDLAVLSGRDELLAEASEWIEALLESGQDDGYFGPPGLKNMKGKDGRVIHDLWPHMVAADALISHHEHTGDPRVVELLVRFFRFCLELPEERYLPRVQGRNYSHYPGVMPFWQDVRAGDFLPAIYWTYGAAGEPWLLELAHRTYRRIRPAGSEWLDHHVVNFTQRFAYPAAYYPLSRDPRHLSLTEYWHAQHLQTWGQQARGIFGADENIRKGCVDPRQGFETCAMVEFAKSFALLGTITGEVIHADRSEDVMLNHFPAALTPDLKALHYLTASNQPQLDDSLEHEYQNKGRQLIYSPHIYRCCQHNVAMGWPWYARHGWMATSDDGLAAWLYGSGEVTARVGASGREVRIRSLTDYPFDGTVRLRIEAAEAAGGSRRGVRAGAEGFGPEGSDGGAAFPLYLRIPGWCSAPSVSVNGEPVAVDASAGSYVRIERQWSSGEEVFLTLPMEIGLTEWPRNGSLTVDRGPLSYSVRVGERWKRCGGTDEWPEWEVLPTSPWNYGLVVDRERPQETIRVSKRRSVGDQPWTVDSAPIELEAGAKRIPGWTLENETVEELHQSPIRSGEPEEKITLVPLGCARLRMACLPRIGGGEDARDWKRIGR